MHCSVKGLILTAIILISFALSCGCTGGEDSSASAGGEKVKVTVTILPQEQFVESVGGDNVDVFVLVPPGADPHSYEPTPSDLAEVSDSDIYVIVGSGIEFELTWLDKIRELNPGITIINSSEGVDLVYSDTEGGADPHIWLSPRNAVKMAENIRDGLSEFDPSGTDYYAENTAAYIGELEDLDSEISDEINASGVKVVMVSHPAWTYFARDYGLEQIAISEEGKEPTPAGIKELVDEAIENNVSTIFVSPEFSSTDADAIAAEIDGKVAIVDPLAEDYLGNMRTVSKAFSGGDDS
ncbi:periplasmic solute binding protein [Methanolacinia petrolearia DSM 11571]|uniref:Periplasmic solute binding protein n=1 Tax=Methanolacinia petrolearia (strain DSM 11571 / OCM 486 / SEBR 4847) TaxID=679926 RepID=E1RK91_METP4|nr:zinc ABC transporter substrate-binding protein [Methanolacinia petrolearia]ADN36904.1 periplasmic solute binding protein [Methanolacinia petrolearia DSM 11571]